MGVVIVRFFSFLIALSLFVTISVQAETITGGPLLQQPKPESILVRWFSKEPNRGVVTLLSDGKRFLETEPTTDHSVLVAGLTPDTRYDYQVSVDGDGIIAQGDFHTAPLPSSLKAVSMLAFGDSGSGDEKQLAMADVIQSLSADLVLHTGDIVYTNGAFSKYPARFLKPYSKILRSVPFFTTIGNHDDEDISGYHRVFEPPSNPEDDERYYAVRYGMVELISLDSNRPTAPGSRQFAWLNALFQSQDFKDSRWRIAFFHHPPFSAAYHGSRQELQEQLSPLFEKYGVDLVLSGHDHDYQRTGGVNLSGHGSKVTYVVTGGGGATLYDRGRKEPRIEKFEFLFNVLHLTATHEKLKVSAIGVDGKEFDSFDLKK